jgi:hypothetical protein
VRSNVIWKLARIANWFWTPPSTRLTGILAPSALPEQKLLFVPPEILDSNWFKNKHLG